MDTDIDIETIDDIKVNGQKNERKKCFKIGLYHHTFINNLYGIFIWKISM